MKIGAKVIVIISFFFTLVSLQHCDKLKKDPELRKDLEAAKKFEKQLKANPANIMAKQNLITAHLKIGYSYHRKGKDKKAIEEYKKALKLDPKMANVHSTLGNLYFDGGMEKEAANEFEIVLQLTPDDPDAHCKLGLLSSISGELDRSESELKKAVELKPDHLEAHKSLMVIYLKREDNEKGEQEKRIIEEIENKTFFPERGEDEEREISWEEIAKKEPDNIIAAYNVAKAQYDKAKEYLNYPLSSLNKPELREIKDALRLIKKYKVLAKKNPDEKKFQTITSQRKSKLRNLFEKRIHRLKRDYAQRREPIPTWILKFEACPKKEEGEK